MNLVSGDVIWGFLGAFLGRCGGFMSPPGAALGRLGVVLAGLEAILRPSWAPMRPTSFIPHKFLDVVGPHAGGGHPGRRKWRGLWGEGTGGYIIM